MARTNPYTESGSSPPTVRLIPLTKGYFAKVDAEDYERVNQFKWCAQVHRYKDGAARTVYAVRSIRKTNGVYTTQKMHCFILGIKGVDHEDHNGLNNQRYNLRPATKKQNNSSRTLNKNSTSGFKGVCWSKASKKWSAHIRVNGINIYLGLFIDIIDAARAYDRAALKYRGAWACTNQMLGLLPPLESVAA